jgi:lysozyme
VGYRLDIVGITNDLKMDEGFRAKPYHDTVGILTVGYGRNLEANGISQAEAELMLSNDIQQAIDDLQIHLSWFNALSDNRQKALVEMCFQLGISGLLEFSNMLKDMANGDFKSAMEEALNSKWAMQVPRRAVRIADLILNG